MKNLIPKIIAKIKAAYIFSTIGVWRETRNTLGIRVVKTLNLSVRSFFDRGLQMKSAALTYSAVLALVPALALMLAISRGFGFQDIILNSLYSYFPSQQKALETGMGFVDSYLKEANNGIFVGVGIIVLLWTLVSLLSTIEETFNNIWDIKKDRTIYQKVTDYIAICLIVPILMVCSSGVSIFMSTILQNNLRLAFLSPLVNASLEAAPLFLAWLAFSLSFYLIPNTKVQLKYAAIAGAVCAMAFQVIQLLFVNGQIYVSKYNAIYGSFSFLPLLLVWMQLSWLVMLFGCVLTYSLQNIFAFNFLGDVTTISHDYRRKIAIVVTVIIFRRFHDGKAPLTRNNLSSLYDIPIRLLSDIIYALHEAGLINNVIIKDDLVGYAPAIEASSLTAGELLRRLDALGDSDFIPRFNAIYPEVVATVDKWNAEAWNQADDVKIIDIDIPNPQAIKNIIASASIDSKALDSELKNSEKHELDKESGSISDT